MKGSCIDYKDGSCWESECPHWNKNFTCDCDGDIDK